jgi:hypothetical protein
MRAAVWTLVTLGLLGGGLGTAQAGFINGNFATGDLTGWTVFTTANGTNGIDFVTGRPLPDVVSFDTTGTGATNSAHFNVGAPQVGSPGGGGIFQDVTLSAGTYTLSGAFASQSDPTFLNIDAGTFTILVDGVVAQSVDLGAFSTPSQILLGDWSTSITLGAGSHEFSFEITRNFLSSFVTPQEYVTNLSLTSGVVPEPASAYLLGAGVAGMIGYGRLRRRIVQD